MIRRGNPFVRAREETSSTHRASHLRTGLSLSWPSHIHIQPNLLKSCHSHFLELEHLSILISLTYKQTLECIQSPLNKMVMAPGFILDGPQDRLNSHHFCRQCLPIKRRHCRLPCGASSRTTSAYLPSRTIVVGVASRSAGVPNAC